MRERERKKSRIMKRKQCAQRAIDDRWRPKMQTSWVGERGTRKQSKLKMVSIKWMTIGECCAVIKLQSRSAVHTQYIIVAIGTPQWRRKSQL